MRVAIMQRLIREGKSRIASGFPGSFGVSFLTHGHRTLRRTTRLKMTGITLAATGSFDKLWQARIRRECGGAQMSNGAQT